MNIFNKHLDKVDEARKQAQTDNNRLIESVLSIGAAQRTSSQGQKQLSDLELEIQNLKLSNKDLKTALMQALVERDELMTKRVAIKSYNERLFNQNDNLHRESDDLLRGDEVDSIVEQFSFDEQMSLMKDIQDTKYKLIKYGFPLSFFA